jgi:hypothetical protein
MGSLVTSILPKQVVFLILGNRFLKTCCLVTGNEPEEVAVV